MEPDGGSGLMKGFAMIGDEHGENIAKLFEANALGWIDVEFGALRVDAFGAAVLQGGEPRAVLRNVGVGTVGIESLANHEHGFAMRIVAAALLRKVDVGSEGKIAGEFLPNEVEAVC